MCLLFKGPLSEFEDENDLLLVVGHIFHRSELLLQSLQVLIKLLGFDADGATATPARGLRRHGVIGRSWRYLRVFIDRVELINFVVDCVK